MSRAPKIIDALGNINPHYLEGVSVPMRLRDVNGAQIDLSARTVRLKTSNGLSKVLLANPEDSLGKLLVLTLAEVQALPVAGVSFAIIDETSDPDDVLWEGKITPRGFK